MAETKIGQPVSRRLGDLLVAEGLINREQLQRALLAQKGTTEKLGSLLVRLSLVNEDQLVGFLARQYGMPSVTLSQLDIDPDVLKLVPAQMARKYEIVPVERKGNVLTLAMADPTNVFALDDVTFLTNLQVQPSVAPQGAIRKAIELAPDLGQSHLGLGDSLRGQGDRAGAAAAYRAALGHPPSKEAARERLAELTGDP